jgi:hypothetical protein
MARSSDQSKGSSDLLLRVLDLRQARIEGEKDILRVQAPTTEEERAELESRRRETLYALEMEGAKLEREFVSMYRGRLLDTFGDVGAFGGLTVGGSGPDLPTCHVACQICITSCTFCVTNCTHCISSCPQCVTSCVNNVF